MQCVGALILADRAPRFDKIESESRRESEAAHTALNSMLTNPQVSINGMTCPNGYIITDEMEEDITNVSNVIRYRDFGATLYPSESMDWSFPDQTVIRSKPDCTGWNESTRTLYIDELKYGWRVVEVSDNWQMIAGAIGAVIRRGFDPQRVIFTLHQPRPYHPDGTVRQLVITREQLEAARLAIFAQVTRTDSVCATGSECYGCNAAGICPSATMAASAALEVASTGTSDDITNNQLGFELMLLDRAEEAIKVRKTALQEIARNRLSQGQHVVHWALKSSQGNRKWIDGVNAETLKCMTGIDVSTVGIISPAQAEKRGVSKDIVASFTIRPSNGFNLVRQDLNKLLGGN